MSNLMEIRQRLQHLSGLIARMRGQLARLSGPEGVELRKKAKEEGTRMGIGAGIALFGVAVVSVAAVYIIAVVILLVNIALDRLWLSALIVVLGSLLVGAATAVIGVNIVRTSVKRLPKLGGDVVQQFKEAGEGIKETVEELQAIARQEAEERQKQMADVMDTVKAVAPYVIGAYVTYRVVKRMVRSHKKRRFMVEDWEED